MSAAAPTTLQEALAQMAHMNQVGTGLQQQLAAAQQQIVALSAPVAAVSPSSSSTSSAAAPLAVAPPPRMPFMRIAAPPSYDGSIGALDKWLATIVQQFDFYAIVTDADRIRYCRRVVD